MRGRGQRLGTRGSGLRPEAGLGWSVTWTKAAVQANLCSYVLRQLYCSFEQTFFIQEVQLVLVANESLPMVLEFSERRIGESKRHFNDHSGKNGHSNRKVQ